MLSFPEANEILTALHHGESPSSDLVRELIRMTDNVNDSKRTRLFRKVFIGLWILTTFFAYFITSLIAANSPSSASGFNPSINPVDHPWMASFWILVSVIAATILWLTKLKD